MVFAITVTIGITTNYRPDSWEYCLGDAYVRAVVRAGGTPLLLPALSDENLIAEAAACCDGFIFTGGGDFDPCYWGEAPSPLLRAVIPQRDYFELALLRYLADDSRPQLGICRGCQALCVAFGGSVLQHIDGAIAHEQKAPRDYPWHAVRIPHDSRLFLLVGEDTLRVNSLHHQAVGIMPRGWCCAAMADDGVVEAVEQMDHPFRIGVQWHPESLNDEASAKLFSGLIRYAGDLSR
ncbi:MAG: gamma-glutamyl-gamma-aminobutyrate hydrolase family protein [Syntrophomonadaceae bacterium]|nr:gamma-glutamyl-gamma-aminobutyrate hydrolase family protein [Syntrophomonadaceae bacterium]